MCFGYSDQHVYLRSWSQYSLQFKTVKPRDNRFHYSSPNRYKNDKRSRASRTNDILYGPAFTQSVLNSRDRKSKSTICEPNAGTMGFAGNPPITKGPSVSPPPSPVNNSPTDYACRLDEAFFEYLYNSLELETPMFDNGYLVTNDLLWKLFALLDASWTVLQEAGQHADIVRATIASEMRTIYLRDGEGRGTCTRRRVRVPKSYADEERTVERLKHCITQRCKGIDWLAAAIGCLKQISLAYYNSTQREYMFPSSFADLRATMKYYDIQLSNDLNRLETYVGRLRAENGWTPATKTALRAEARIACAGKFFPPWNHRNFSHSELRRRKRRWIAGLADYFWYVQGIHAQDGPLAEMEKVALEHFTNRIGELQRSGRSMGYLLERDDEGTFFSEMQALAPP